ncbi:MAG: hypothetical protein RL318_1042 [Fibrobacterota bacterium]|jgi:hypothetical protein
MRRAWTALALCLVMVIPSQARKKQKTTSRKKQASVSASLSSGVSYRLPVAVIPQENRGWMYSSEVAGLGRIRPRVDYSEAQSWKLQPLSSQVSAPIQEDTVTEADSLVSRVPTDLFASLGLAEDQSLVGRLRQAAQPYLGIPYKGRKRGVTGYDCSGFVRALLGDFGVSLSGRSSQDYFLLGDPIQPSELQPGDLVFFSDNTRRIGHVGMYVDSGVFVHSALSSGITYSRMDEAWYRRRYQGARRISTIASALQVGPIKSAGVSSEVESQD